MLICRLFIKYLFSARAHQPKKLDRTMSNDKVIRAFLVCAEELFDLDDSIFIHNVLICSLMVFHRLKLHSMSPKTFMVDSWIHRYENHMFFRMFRVTKDTFHVLAEAIGRADLEKTLSKKYKGGHHAIDLKSHVLISVWYFATGDTLLSIGNRFNISPTTVMNVINRILYFLVLLKDKYIIFPNRDEVLTVAQGFKNYPGTVGAIDGTHIFMKVERKQQDSYIDRYRRHSINLMAICDSNRFFTYIFVGFPGSVHDSRVFQNSALYKAIETHGSQILFDENFHFIGDSAFGLRTWLMTPYKGYNLTTSQKKHNYKLSADRVAIEHAFGLLKGRWRRLQFINVYDMGKATEIATACCVLHNFCMFNKDLWDEEYHIDLPDTNVYYTTEVQREGKIKRDRIASSF